MIFRSLAMAGVAVTLATASAQAAMTGEGFVAPAAGALTEPVQFDFPDPLGLFIFGGRDYCWYDDGWRGPGWYWCGYGYNEGVGYGGGEGYHGWSQHRYERDWRGHGGGGMQMHPHNGEMQMHPHNGEMHPQGGGGMPMHQPGGGGMQMHQPGGGMQMHQQGGGGQPHGGGPGGGQPQGGGADQKRQP